MRLIAVDKTGSSLCLIDADKLGVLKRLPMPVAPHDFAQDPSGERLFVSIYGTGVYGDNPLPGHEIVIVDPVRLDILGSIDTMPYTSPHGLAFDRQGLMWVTCDAHSSLLCIDTNTGLILHVVDTRSRGSHWVLASALTGCLYTSNKEDRFISVIDPARALLKGIIRLPNGSEGMCFSPDGRILYVADHIKPCVLAINVITLLIEQTIELVELAKMMRQQEARTSHHMRVCISADGTTLAVAAYHFDHLILVPLSNPDLQFTLVTGKGPVAMTFDALNQHKLYVSNHDEGTIAVVDINRNHVVNSAYCDAGIEAMRFL